jgi:hypothetical protein
LTWQQNNASFSDPVPGASDTQCIKILDLVVDTINQESDFAQLSDYLTTMVSDQCMQSQWRIVVSELGKTRDLELRV